MENSQPLLNALDTDLAYRMSSRRDLFVSSAKKLGVLATVPLVLAAVSQEAFGKGLPKQVVNVLNFALTLEYIESAFYQTALSKNFIPKQHLAVFRQISAHETEHVNFLKGALGSAAVKPPKADFTAGGKYADVFSNFATFLKLSQTFEDLGVAAYKGQARNLLGSGGILTAALQIHSVEARHAAAVRAIGGLKPWTGAFDEPKTKGQVLAAAKPFLKA